MIAQVLREMALFLEMEGSPYRPRAYEKAAYTVANTRKPLTELYAEAGASALEALPGIGHSIAQKIVELITQGTIDDLERLRQRTPVDLVGLTRIEGVGPRTVKALYDNLGVHDVDSLEAAARAGLIHNLPHFGHKLEEKFLKHIAFLRQTLGRRPLWEVLPLVSSVEARLRKHPAVRIAEAAGSVRRRKETVGDVDFVVAATDPHEVVAFFIGMPEVEHVYAHGDTKALVRLREGLDADLRVVPPEVYGAALLYFTGSKAHNIALRRLALQQGYKLNEYGLFRDEQRIATRTEAELYKRLGLAYIAPELREDRGEIEAAGAGKLPRLIEASDLQGDLQVHSLWSDGSHSIEAMLAAAERLGNRYIVITDHTRDLPMARGMDEERLLAQKALVEEIRQRGGACTLLSGAEVNIRADGTLDVHDDVLQQLDVVGAAVHSNFQQSRHEMTERVLRAIRNPHVDILFHPTGRAIGRRQAVDLDMEAVLRAAQETGTVVEIDAQPERLDLDEDHVRMALAMGVKLSIDSDAHDTEQLRYARELGVAVARRAWVQKTNVVNALPVEAFLKALKGRGGRKAKRAER